MDKIVRHLKKRELLLFKHFQAQDHYVWELNLLVDLWEKEQQFIYLTKHGLIIKISSKVPDYNSKNSDTIIHKQNY
jgi:hypothetical protein